MIKTTTLNCRKRVQWKSTGHNYGDYEHQEQKKLAAQARFTESNKPRHLPRAGS